jgi:hypothetical protein
MVKEIKGIKCPQCGSAQNTEVKPDLFRCGSCGTESSTPASPGRGRNVLFIFFGAVGLITMISLLFHAMNAGKLAGVSGSSSVASIKGPGDYANEYTYWSSANTLFFRSGAGTGTGAAGSGSFDAPGSGDSPLLVVVGKREYHPMSGDETKSGIYLSFYDILKRKELSAKKIAPGQPMTSTDVQLRTFYNGDIYFTIDRKKIYRVDRSALEAEDVTATLFNHQPRLRTGVVRVAFVPDTYGDGFSVLTNDGKTYFYYPLVSKLYTEDELNGAQYGFHSLPGGGSEKVYFTFTARDVDLPNEKLQLLRITYKDNNGGPKDRRTNFSWRQDHGRSGIFADAGPYKAGPYKKELITSREKRSLRITSWSDLTPGRLYFDPQVVYGDAGSLLILFRANAEPDAPLSLQSLDPGTGSVKWTVACSTDGKPDKALPFRDGFILVKGNATQVLDANGAMKGQYKLK